ncbi:hypothetical protein PV04_03194 [Phialophora macrospora]|uniref:25S rRNA adenine-N(1) methyltransferase n=1 Tax=Phialophora macrospora TaxID=1851006 RepID=A0A0D2E9I1_9EURO|nr:hypothetical protein PV04_03194 [Phialophora macrospora]
MARIQQPTSSAKSKSKLRSSRRSKSKPRSLKTGRPPLLFSSPSSTIDTSTPTTNGNGSGKVKPKAKPNAAAAHANSSSLSSKHTRALINTHHLLQKRLATARAQANTAQIQALETQLAAQGGLKAYQLASRTGQSRDRGGDSSRLLVRWLDGELRARREALRQRRRGRDGLRSASSSSSRSSPSSGSDSNAPSSDNGDHVLRILEVGALSTENALNIPEITAVRRIDLRSSGPGIEEVDFMDLPVPRDSSSSSSSSSTEDKCREGGRGGYYDVLSLSLVLNYVPDATARGEMLKRTTLFLRRSLVPPLISSSASHDEQQTSRTDDVPVLPGLFLVLPAPCLHNSRYLTGEHLAALLNSLGYCLVRAKTTRKLYYSLWRYDGPGAREEWVRKGGQTVFKKREINPGGGRNNFCIVLDGDHVS